MSQITSAIFLCGLVAVLSGCSTEPISPHEPDSLTEAEPQKECENQVQVMKPERQAPSKRVALVIGIGKYHKAPLENPTNDADDMAKVLECVGFDVIKVKNASLKDMKMAINTFGEKLKQAEVGLFYFAGHGMQYQGENYLFPIGAMDTVKVAEHLQSETLNATYVLSTMKYPKNESNLNLNIVILDACRNNPFRTLLRQNRGLDQEGLALMEVPSGSLIAYATRPNMKASDGNGKNSPYVKHLKQEILKPGISILDMLTNVRAAVMQETSNYQAPGFYSELNRTFCFVGPCQKPDKPSSSAQCVVDKRSPLSSDKLFRDALQVGGEGPQMVWVEPGSFKMGDLQGQGFSNEKPVQEVYVSHFAIGRYEVTFAEYDHFVKATGSQKPDDEKWGRDKRPVINVSWKDATAYADWLTQQTRETYRLPTEAEWEYAARAGTETAYWWGNEIKQNYAVCDGCGSEWDTKKTAPVGCFPANAFGLHDTVSNVWEWTCSEYEEQYAGQEQECVDNTDAKGLRVTTRGGSWFTIPKGVRAAFRFKLRPTERYNEVGFRVVRIPKSIK